MEIAPATHSTFVIERHYPVPPARVFAAFADPGQRRRWFAEGRGNEIVEYRSDLRVGGEAILHIRLSENTPLPGMEIVNAEHFHDVVEDRRIVMAQRMTLGDKRISSALVTIEFLPADGGTDMICTHQSVFLEGADGPEMRQQGWQELFDRLGAALT